MDEATRAWTYAEGPTTSVSTDIAGSVDDVWTLVSDITLPARFSTELAGVEWIDGFDAPAVGARFRGRNEHQAIGGWEVVCTIRECTPGHALEWCVGDPEFPSSVWRFDLAANGDTITLTQTFRMGPAPSGLTPAIEAMPDKEAKIIARRLAEHRTNMEANLEGVRALVEGDGA
ncbi:MAG: SRPBCC family protein [Acidimicrobiales bacterium]